MSGIGDLLAKNDRGSAQNAVVLVAVAAGEDGSGWLRDLDEVGAPTGPITTAADLAAAVATRELADKPRWVWASTAVSYPRLLRLGVRVGRCASGSVGSV